MKANYKQPGLTKQEKMRMTPAELESYNAGIKQNRAQRRHTKPVSAAPHNTQVLYECDPDKNTTCSKLNCKHTGTGTCVSTKHLECAKQPVKTVKLAMSASEEDYKDVAGDVADE